MAVAILRRLFRLPPAGARINYAHPSAAGLIGAWVAHEGGGVRHNLVTDRAATHGSGVSWANKQIGPVTTHDGTTTNAKIDTQESQLTPTGGGLVSVMARVRVNGATGTNGIIEQTGATNVINTAWLLFRDTATWYWRINNNQDVSTPATGDVWVTLAGTYSAGRQILYLDGVAIQSGVGNVSFSDCTGNVLIGHLGSGFYPFNGDIAWIYVWRRELTAAEVQQITIDPYALLQPIARRLSPRIVAPAAVTIFLYPGEV